MNREGVEKILGERGGRVLAGDTIIKSDQYVPSTYLDAFEQILLSGAPNFRRVSVPATNINLYGVGQPTLYGIRGVLNLIRYSALRNVAVFAGVEASTLDDMESRLKADILEEAVRNQGMTIIHEETKDQRVLPCWEALSSQNVKTPHEAYADLHNDNFEVSFERLPAAPEGKFRKKTIMKLIEMIRRIIKSTTERVHIVFNCQLGMGRSTIAMILAYMTLLPADATTFEAPSPKVSGELGLAASGAIAAAAASLNSEDPTGYEPYKRGEYPAVLSLVRVLERGFALKRFVDHAIDVNGMFVNIREEIYKWKKSSDLADEVDRNVEDTRVAIQRAVSNLERYMSLIIFCAYVNESRPLNYPKSFRDWLAERRELGGLIDSIHTQPEHELIIQTDHSLDAYDNIIQQRRGQVLTRGSILKADHFPSILRGQLIDGAPNFRRVKGSDIFACAMPSVDGVSNVLRHVGHNDFPKQYIWINLREEPVIYINGSPFVLRNVDKPLRNLTLYEGITGEQLEKMEVRFKADIVAEVKRHHGQLLVHDETEARQLAPIWVRVTDVRTPREVFDGLMKDGYDVHYVRIPVTTEHSPEVKDFDEVVHLLTRPEYRNRKIIFNCQIGRGRSTTGTVMGFLIKYYIEGLKHTPESDEDGAIAHSTQPPVTPASPARNSRMGSTDHLPRTDFAITNALVRLLKEGQRTKRLTDWAIDQCAATQNLRLTILGFMHRADSARTTEELDSYLARAGQYLERYFWLIVFNSYLSENWKDSFVKPFERWLHERPELVTLMKELHHSPQGSLQISKLQPIDKSDPRTLVAHRIGDVLAAGTILKFDHFPGCQRKGLEPVIEGAPNFRKVEGLNVYGVAIPTIDGVQNVLRYLDAGPLGKIRVVWTNLREEPIVYVNGRPYVVRSEHKAYENLEHTGINTQRIEQMEGRLVQDLQTESRTHDGNIVLHDENSQGELVPHWEPAPAEDSSREPRRVYEDLMREGWHVQYNRVGITDEQSPTASEFDELIHMIADADASAHLIFNCQMGRGRTTTGMVIACMYKRWLAQTPLRHETLIPGGADSAVTSRPLLAANTQASPPSSSGPTSSVAQASEWKLIARGVRALKNGIANRTETDTCIDMCSVMQNLREAIRALKSQADAAVDPIKKEALDSRALNYLKRYYYLILFCAYLHEYLPAQGSGVFRTSFQAWLHSRPELLTLVEKATLSEISTAQALTPSVTPIHTPSPGTPVVTARNPTHIVKVSDADATPPAVAIPAVTVSASPPAPTVSIPLLSVSEPPVSASSVAHHPPADGRAQLTNPALFEAHHHHQDPSHPK